jgi:ribosomal protein L10
MNRKKDYLYQSTKEFILNSNIIIITQYNQMTSEEIMNLRSDIISNGGHVKITKNTFLKKILNDIKLKPINLSNNLFHGPTLVISFNTSNENVNFNKIVKSINNYSKIFVVGLIIDDYLYHPLIWKCFTTTSSIEKIQLSILNTLFASINKIIFPILHNQNAILNLLSNLEQISTEKK